MREELAERELEVERLQTEIGELEAELAAGRPNRDADSQQAEPSV
jgi:hypothetical protein